MSTEQLAWFTSSYSGSGGGDCVEVALTQASVHIRDSKNTAGPVLRVHTESWCAFIASAGTEADSTS